MDQERNLGKRSTNSSNFTRKGNQFHGADHLSAPQIVSRNYKTKDCQFYLRGICRRGEDCTFSHDMPLVKSKVICKFFLTENCHKGSECFYSHELSNYPCRHLNIWGNCKKRSNCTFSHEVFENEEALIEWIKENKKEISDAFKRGLSTDIVEFYKKNVGLFMDQPQETEEQAKTSILMPGLDFSFEKSFEECQDPMHEAAERITD